MTIHIPEPNIFDKILSIFGKKRGIIIPDELCDKFGPYSYFKGERENFLVALLRPKKVGFLNGVFDKDEIMTNIEIKISRREVLFCHDLLSFIEDEFLDVIFGDDFKGSSKTEVYFIHNNAFYIVEGKSEVETENSKHPGWKGTFQEVRDAIRRLNINNQYNKWLLYLAQLNDYASPEKRSKKAENFLERFVILGLPLSKLSDFQKAVDIAVEKISISGINWQPKQDKKRSIAYVLMKENELSKFISAILENK